MMNQQYFEHMQQFQQQIELQMLQQGLDPSMNSPLSPPLNPTAGNKEELEHMKRLVLLQILRCKTGSCRLCMASSHLRMMTQMNREKRRGPNKKNQLIINCTLILIFTTFFVIHGVSKEASS